MVREINYSMEDLLGGFFPKTSQTIYGDDSVQEGFMMEPKEIIEDNYSGGDEELEATLNEFGF